MKYLKYITNGALFALLLAGCSDDLDNKPVVLPVSGDEIEFGAAPGGFTDVNPESRTIYDVPAGSTFDTYTLLNIKWQYDIDQVRVYCPEGAEGFKTADYTVKETTDASSGTSTGFLVKNGETGVRWGDTNTDHHFYAFYSLDRIDNGLQSGTTVTATIPTGQEGGQLLTYNNQGEEDAKGKFKIITPDMSFCLMAGEGTWTSGSDKNVALTFTPIATVLDVLVNGPSSEQAGGIDAMKIVSVSVRSKSGKNIVGTFSYDLATKTYDFSATDGSQTATSIATVQTIDPNTTNPVEIKTGEQLNVKFFLLPREVPNGDLVVSVFTEGGVVYNKTVSRTDGGTDDILSAGMITRIKTPELGGQNTNNWMSQVPDNALFTQLSLPGSKNSFAYRVDAGYDPQTGLSKFYQSLPPLGINATVETTTQFDEGIRVFDVHLNLSNGTPVVYAGGANVSPQITLATVLNTLRDKVNPDNETASECAVVFLNYVNDNISVSTWLSAVMTALNSWNSSNGGILTTLDENTTMGDVRGNVAVIINLQTSDIPTGSAPVNYINKFSTSVQNTSIVSAPYSSGATVRIQNLQQCNNPEITSGETPYVYKGKGIGLVPYFITRENKLDGASFNLIETKRSLMKKLNSEIAQGGQHLYINDLSGFCVTKNASSTGYLTYTEFKCNDNGWWTTRYEWDETGTSGTIYDYNDFPKDESVYTNPATGAGTSWTVESRPAPSSDYENKLWLQGAGYDLGNGGNTCLFAELFNGEAVTEYSSLIGDLRQPLGIVLMNFAGVAKVEVSNRSYAVQGIRLPGLIMMNNFMFPLKTGTTTTRTSSDTSYSKEGNVWD
jgi:hypothetical protein